MAQTTPTPAGIARTVNATRERAAAGARDRWMRQRRQAAREAGYRGPLTRAELTRLVRS